MGTRNTSPPRPQGRPGLGEGSSAHHVPHLCGGPEPLAGVGGSDPSVQTPPHMHYWLQRPPLLSPAPRSPELGLALLEAWDCDLSLARGRQHRPPRSGGQEPSGAGAMMGPEHGQPQEAPAPSTREKPQGPQRAGRGGRLCPSSGPGRILWNSLSLIHRLPPVQPQGKPPGLGAFPAGPSAPPSPKLCGRFPKPPFPARSASRMAFWDCARPS